MEDARLARQKAAANFEDPWLKRYHSEMSAYKALLTWYAQSGI
mgnify:CR=1 FL=1